MRLKNYASLRFRKILRGLFHVAGKSFQRSPVDVVKANTKEAFEFFWSQDDFINQHYLEPTRLALFELVAEYCSEILMTSNDQVTVRVADIGCGTGHMLDALKHKLAPRFSVEMFGLDFASTATSRAKALLPTATFVAEEIYENSLPSDFFDLVLSIETLEHLRWPEKGLLEILRICKPAGTVVVTVPNGEKDSWDGHVNFWNVTQFSEFLSPYGLVDIKLLRDDTNILGRLIKYTLNGK